MADDRGDVLRSALETFDEPMLLWRPDGRVAFASRRFLEAFALEREEVEGAEEEEFDAALARRGAGPVSAAPVVSLAAPSGRRFERRARALPGGGRMEVFRDLAAGRDAAARREELLGVATHDLRSPLANVRSYAGLLLGGRLAHLDPRIRRSAEVIARNADKALRLLQAYFDSQRAETGEWDIDRTPADLLAVLREVVVARRAVAAEKGVEVTASLPTSLPPLPLDRERMGGAVGALLDNAIARSPSPSIVEVVCESRPGAVWVGFVDRGEPMAPEDQGRVFDRDAQILRERQLGLGFAVSMAGAVVAAHGGTAEMSSAPGRTVFSLSLPFLT